MSCRWLERIERYSGIRELIESAAPGARVMAEGAWGSSGHLLAGAVARQGGPGGRSRRRGGAVLLVVAHLDEADEAKDDLELFKGLEVEIFPALELMPGESHVSLELLADRLAVVGRLHEGQQPDVIIAPVQALMQAVPEREAISSLAMQVSAGQTLDPQALIRWLGDAGYQRVDVVEEPGDFAVRGGIVDVMPPGGLPPVRIDFFGDEVDEIAEIDPDTMGSTGKRQGVRLIGASAEMIQQEERTTNLWSLLRNDTLVVLQETLEIAEQARGYYERLTDATGIIPPDQVQKGLGKLAIIEANQFAAPGMAEHRVAMPVRALPNFATDAAEAVGDLAALARGDEVEAGRQVVVIAQRQAECDRLRELIEEHAPDVAEQVRLETGYLFRGFIWEGPEEGTDGEGGDRGEEVGSTGGRATSGTGGERHEVADGKGERGLEAAARAGDKLEGGVALVPHHELMHRYQTRRRIRRVGVERAVDSFLDIDEGDYVVHIHHGIARFRGMRTMRRDKGAGEGGRGGSEEYLTLEFAGRALLHVPASQIELVHKYVGGFAGRPPLSKLGGTRWKKQKEAAKEAAKSLASELLRIHAAREAMPGFRYGEDSRWMHQFEAEFPYEETEDQLAGIQEIKKDMISTRPMDRLICGDVGYGKTEIAMRAAFKAVDAGKQVAVLCPTTVLCEQHERTFRERMADYPVRIASLNRFKSAQDVRLTLEAVKAGKLDILIGTHRLLSDDVRFADLGLVVIDEEQRFGVEHKSKLLSLRMTVDVLTLSATPIPRTLHMALLGLRDISSLSTPPADRRAVMTEVIPFDEKRIRTAVLRELNRGGQVFFVHNRVKSIQRVAQELSVLVPEAKLAIGHGQMPGRELERVMLKFINQEVDVLVCTTIIESGIDIPSANTMVITEADHFGLAELHQLRGRVGRYKHRAYCYLTLPQTRTLSEVALRRLRAIEEFSMLGAGFKIAMRDMEIRGVGNILGPEQSGHIAVVGYEMYCQLLEEATNQLKRQPSTQPVQTHLELEIAGHLPKRYIPSSRHRMEAYRRISRAADLATLGQVEKDLVDAYGELPEAAATLLQLAEIRVALTQQGVESLKRDGPDLIFTLRDVRRLSPLLEDAPGSVRLVDTPTEDRPGTVYYRPPANYLDNAATLLAVLRKLLVRPLEVEAVGV